MWSDGGCPMFLGFKGRGILNLITFLHTTITLIIFGVTTFFFLCGKGVWIDFQHPFFVLPKIIPKKIISPFKFSDTIIMKEISRDFLNNLYT